MYNKNIISNAIEHMNCLITVNKNKGRFNMSQVISLINEKGGVGKSTSAITIAQIPINFRIQGTDNRFRSTDEYIQSIWSS